MIIEIREYTLKPNCREAFIVAFETANRKALRDAGMLVFGPMRDLEDPDKVHWMRAFETLEARENIKSAFYDSPAWHDHIEPMVMPLIEHFEAKLVETTARFERFDGNPTL